MNLLKMKALEDWEKEIEILIQKKQVTPAANRVDCPASN